MGERACGRLRAGVAPRLVVGLGLTAVAACGSPYPAVQVTAPADVVCGAQRDHAPEVRSYADVLPNTRFRTAGSAESATPLTPLVVVGEVETVTPGPGWNEAGDRIGFDDEDALWKHVHVTVAVTEVLGSAGWVADHVKVAFPLEGSATIASARSQLAAEGPWVLPLRRWAGVEYDPGLWSVGPEDAVLLAEVGPGGRLSLPCVGPARAGRLLAEVPTLAALRTAATRPVRERVVVPAHLG